MAEYTGGAGPYCTRGLTPELTCVDVGRGLQTPTLFVSVLRRAWKSVFWKFRVRPCSSWLRAGQPQRRSASSPGKGLAKNRGQPGEETFAVSRSMSTKSIPVRASNARSASAQRRTELCPDRQRSLGAAQTRGGCRGPTQTPEQIRRDPRTSARRSLVVPDAAAWVNPPSVRRSRALLMTLRIMCSQKGSVGAGDASRRAVRMGTSLRAAHEPEIA